METYGKLHPTQAKLLQILSEVSGPLPSLRHLAKRIDIASPNTIAHHLEQLRRKGYLVFHPGGGFEVNEHPLRDIVYLPLYGNAACGTQEFFSEENIEEHVPVPARTFRVGQDYFLVRARGDSMEPRIHNDDLLVVQPQVDIASGAIMVVSVDDGVFAKRVFRSEQAIVLQSLNPKYEPRVLGVESDGHVIGLVRAVIHQGMN